MTFDNIYIDVFNQFFRWHHAKPPQRVRMRSGMLEVQGIMGLLAAVKKIHRVYGNPYTKVFLCADNATSRPSLRKEINPDYKSNRVIHKSAVYSGIRLFMMLAKYYHDDWYTCRVPGLEADDHVPALIMSRPAAETHLAVSTDLDWARVIGYNCRQVQWDNGRGIVDKKYFVERYGYEPSEETVVLYKTLRGDSSDHIPPGCPKIPEKVVLQLLEEGTIYDILDSLDTLEISQTWKSKLAENARQLRLNHEMISFIPIAPEKILGYVKKGKRNLHLVNRILRLLGQPLEKPNGLALPSQFFQAR